ncbi:MAG: hypothetical protein AB7O45_17015 [Alphaproteobacteria bacterium]
MARLADRRRYPALERVVVAGHSAGGQVAARWAPATEVGERLSAAGIALRFVIANPSSWLYFDARRPVAGGDGFAVPDASHCAGYDRWKYGLVDAVPYAAAMTGPDMARRFLGHDLVILLGGADDDPRHRFLDRSCAAALQGPHRLARGLTYSAYLTSWANESAPRHRVLVVPGVGHDNKAMFGSACGRDALFGIRGC